VKEAVGDVLGYEGRRVIKLCHELQAENALLKAKVEGLKEAVHVKKKRKKPKKDIFTELRGEEGSGAIFFSPAKISAARKLQAQKAKEEEEAQAQREQDKLQKQQRKEEQAELKRAAATARQERREKLVLEKAQKEAQKEEALQQRLANLQLLDEQRTTAKDQRKKPQKPQHQASSGGGDVEVAEQPMVVADEMTTSRSGRQLRKPQRLPNYQLQLESSHRS
jgi:hypothetical protein